MEEGEIQWTGEKGKPEKETDEGEVNEVLCQ